jgi:NAD(P)-dependent dehydrogenase (short-subunit alcohol dehydrogenase family)
MPEGGGSIVNTASMMGLSGGGLYPNVSYHASKGGLVTMTRALAVEWAPRGIRVNAVAPTWTDTRFIGQLTQNPELMARIRSVTPLQRMAEPHEVASAILFLASPAAAMVTGHVLAVYGGFLAQ